jgi:hypothetical protein
VDGAKKSTFVKIKIVFGYDLSAIPLDTLRNQKIHLELFIECICAYKKIKTTFFQ